MADPHPVQPIWPPPPVPPTPLEDHLVLAPGQDPILLGATGYADTVFTLRLAGGTT